MAFRLCRQSSKVKVELPNFQGRLGIGLALRIACPHHQKIDSIRVGHHTQLRFPIDLQVGTQAAQGLKSLRLPVTNVKDRLDPAVVVTGRKKRP